MNEILQFLCDLQANNTREWFNANKARYQKVQKYWNDFCVELINEVGLYDEDIAKLSLNQCTYRIYRDTRFSNDKSPYKTHFGVFLAPGGKKSMHAGYYFHVGTGESKDYPCGHMLAAGNYCYDKRVVSMLREDISFDWEEFRDEVLGVADTRFELSEMDALKKVPKGFDATAPYADWMRQKAYCIACNVDNDFLLQPNLVQRVAELFRTTKPFIDYVNRAVDFSE